jgi:hypothetical protein
MGRARETVVVHCDGDDRFDQVRVTCSDAWVPNSGGPDAVVVEVIDGVDMVGVERWREVARAYVTPDGYLCDASGYKVARDADAFVESLLRVVLALHRAVCAVRVEEVSGG